MIISKDLKVQVFHNLVMELKVTRFNSSTKSTRVDLEILETCFNVQVFKSSFNTNIDFDSFEDHDLILETLNFLKLKEVQGLNEILEFVGLNHL